MGAAWGDTAQDEMGAEQSSAEEGRAAQRKSMDATRAGCDETEKRCGRRRGGSGEGRLVWATCALCTPRGRR